MSPSFTCIRIYGKVFSFSDRPRFLGYFSSFIELNAEKKTATLPQEWLFFVCFIVNYTFLTLFSDLFRRPRITDVSLRKSFQKRPIGNITVCNRKSPVFGIYVIARLYAIFFCVFPSPLFCIFSESLANPDIDGNTTVFIKTSPYNAEL